MEERRRGQLLLQCLPISCMKLLDEYLLVIAEGPCLLLSQPKIKYGDKYKRFQIFPNQLTITGIEFIEDSCGYPARQGLWDGPNENHSVAFVWAGNHGIFITLNRTTCDILSTDTFPSNQNKALGFDYIPIGARWFDDGRVFALLSVFNYVVAYERTLAEDCVRESKQIAKYECEPENLYSGVMDGENLDKLLVFSGTTFKGILVWEIEEGKAIVKFKLTGHQGIPFSLEYNREWNMLLSASDDRSVLVWAFTDTDQSHRIIGVPIDIDDGFIRLQRNQKKEKLPSNVRITHIIRGHDSRVWKAIWVNHAGFAFIVSVGEDSFVRMSSYDRTAVKNWKAHDGAPIYQCAYDKLDDLLYTAAHDGSVYSWKRFYLKSDATILPFDQIAANPWTDAMNKVNQHGRSLINKDYPRDISLYNTNYVVASMNSGRIIAFYTYNKKQFSLFYDERFERYSILRVSRQRSMIAVGGLNGDFILLQMSLEDKPYSPTCSCLFAEKIWSQKFESKILNIIWLSDDSNNRVLIVCLEKTFLFRFLFKDEKKTEVVGECLQTFSLKIERPGIPTAIITQSKYIVAGDEVGSLLVLQVDIPDGNIVHICKNVHRESVTNIVEYKSKIMTAGRYGGVKSFNLEGDGSNVRLVQVHEFLPPFEWVGKLLPVLKEDDLLLGGFQKGNFIIYSWKDKRILNEITDVGGGHRKWDFKFGQGNAVFSYIRDKEIFFSTTSIEDRRDNILKPGLHCKTINCGIGLQRKEKDLYIATGSEDGTIRVFRFDFNMNKYYPIHRINSHASSVRTLACLDIDEDHTMLFSGGGHSEVFAFLIGIGAEEELTILGKVDVVKQKIKVAEIDTRVMDLLVTRWKNKIGEENVMCFCACSDGIIRVLAFCLKTKKFIVTSALHGNGHAIIRIQLIQKQDYIIIFGATSNGFLIAWKWEVFENQGNQFDKEPRIIKSFFSKQVRKAAVMSFKIYSLSELEDYLVVLGSDDCCVSVWKLRISQKLDKIQLESLWAEDQTQRSAVVDVDICDNLIYTCSNDQVISRWDFNGNLLGTALAGVPDCQGFIVSASDDCITCFGDGVTWITCP